MPSQYYSEDSRDKALRILQERNMDGTGPEGKGPRTGRGLGKCPPEDTEEMKEDQGVELEEPLAQEEWELILKLLEYNDDDKNCVQLFNKLIGILPFTWNNQGSSSVKKPGPEGKGPKTGRGMGKCESEDMSETKGPLSRYQVKARTPEETPPKPTQKDLQILKQLPPELLEKAKAVGMGDEELDDELYEILFDSDFIEGMPYGTQKARTGDPYEWIANKLEMIFMDEQKEGKECAEKKDDEEEKTEDTEDVVDKDEGIGGGESGEGAQEEVEEEKKDDEEEVDEEAQFTEWFNEQMKKYEFDEGIFDGVKKFIGVAKDVGVGVKAGAKAAKAGKGVGDVLSIAGTQMKANKFQRAYKEMWLGFNKGLKLMNPKLQAKISENKKVRDSVNAILGSIVEALERGKTLNLANAAQKAVPVGTNPEQAEAAAAEKEGGEATAAAV